MRSRSTNGLVSPRAVVCVVPSIIVPGQVIDRVLSDAIRP
jgi:hypothetical protein